MGSLNGSGETRVGIGKGGIAEFAVAQALPADLAGCGWIPLGRVVAQDRLQPKSRNHGVVHGAVRLELESRY
ncbi:MAG: hypothetical protein KGQ59_04825 [Bdellovibrionales bacterium]|nr:hypothetical protein [Bdellovibrionales bacterium]